MSGKPSNAAGGVKAALAVVAGAVLFFPAMVAFGIYSCVSWLVWRSQFGWLWRYTAKDMSRIAELMVFCEAEYMSKIPRRMYREYVEACAALGGEKTNP